ncbi:cryptochrome 2 [Corchorus olitorius]|uniref:Cryptochrome 2 n=2 Tax=Corchorus TaxID=93758 RepID=A0A1R3K4U0_9ROSI|nr:cryptochrome 2 [Corchorus olitorius]
MAVGMARESLQRSVQVVDGGVAVTVGAFNAHFTDQSEFNITMECGKIYTNKDVFISSSVQNEPTSSVPPYLPRLFPSHADLPL